MMSPGKNVERGQLIWCNNIKLVFISKHTNTCSPCCSKQNRHQYSSGGKCSVNKFLAIQISQSVERVE